MKKSVFSTLVLSSLSLSCFAEPTIFNEPSDVQSYYKLMARLVERYGANKIAQVIDVDGVLTDRSSPEGRYPPQPRGHMDLAVRDFCCPPSPTASASPKGELEGASASSSIVENTQGVFTVFASAWVPFSETVARLRKLTQLFVDVDKTLTETERFIVMPDKSQISPEPDSAPGPVEVLRHGRAVSCRNVFEVPEASFAKGRETFSFEGKHYAPYSFRDGKNYFYRLKHLTLDSAKGREDRDLKAVVFVDDSQENGTIFRELMATTKWFENVEEVYILKFTNVFGYLSEMDLLERYQAERPIAVGYSSSSEGCSLSDEEESSGKKHDKSPAEDGGYIGSSPESRPRLLSYIPKLSLPSSKHSSRSCSPDIRSCSPEPKRGNKYESIRDGFNLSDGYEADIDQYTRAPDEGQWDEDSRFEASSRSTHRHAPSVPQSEDEDDLESLILEEKVSE